MANDTTLYQRLAGQFHQKDTALNNEDLGILYYGYALLPSYNPLKEDRVLDAASSLGRRGRLEEARHLLDNFLSKQPACLAALLESAYTAYLMDDSLQTVLGYHKYFSLLEVPIRSGTGESFDKAFVVSSNRDIELVLDKLGFASTAQSLVQHNGLHFQIVQAKQEEGAKKQQTFYFNVELPRRGMQEDIQQQKPNRQ